MKFHSVACLLALPALLAGGCTVRVDSQAQMAREERRFPVTGVPVVHLSTFDGTIEVQSWDRPEVLVAIEKRGPTKEAIDGIEVKASQNGGVIDVDVVRRGEPGFGGLSLHWSASARLVVSVPRKTDLRARTGDGSIRVSHISGQVDVHTGDGSIRAEDLSGTLSLESGDGSIAVDGAEGRLALETGDGSVNVAGTLGAVRLHSGDGSIVYRAGRGSAMVEDWDISTGDGTVSVYLPGDFDAQLDAHTGDGGIRNDLAVSPAGAPAEHGTVVGTLGKGGRHLKIRTGDGSIRLGQS